MRKLTTSEVINRFIAQHGDRYDYSKTVYLNSKTNVTVGCRDHGDFYPSPYMHSKGTGCPACAGQYSPTTEEWIARAKQVHGERYCYSKADYVNSTKKVIIVCKRHGEFRQEAGRHVREKFGCPKCAGFVDDVNGFISKAKECHGDRYDYSETVYRGARERLNIRCRAHGVFEQIAGGHTTGSGCNLCADITRGRSSKGNISDFIARSKDVHGGAYTYEKSKYNGYHNALIISCANHGFFEQSPASHLSGSGCPKCAGRGFTTSEWVERCREAHEDVYDYSKTEYKGPQHKSTVTCREHGDFKLRLVEHLGGRECPKCHDNVCDTDTFIEKSKVIHEGKYIYDKSEYVKSDQKVIITCPSHGDFEQSPNGHLSGKGCQRCPSDVFDPNQPTSIYLMQMGAQVKIGISIHPEKRLSELNRSNPKPAHIITTWTLEDFPAAHTMEQRIHRKLKLYHAGLSGFAGATEWFNTTPEHAEQVVNDAIDYCQKKQICPNIGEYRLIKPNLTASLQQLALF